MLFQKVFPVVPHRVNHRGYSAPPHPKHFVPKSSVATDPHRLGEQDEAGRRLPGVPPSAQGTGSPEISQQLGEKQ